MQSQSNQHEIPLSRERSFPNEENALFSLPILRKGRNKVGVLLFLRQTLTCVAPLRQGRGCVPPAQPTSRIFRKRYFSDDKRMKEKETRISWSKGGFCQEYRKSQRNRHWSLYDIQDGQNEM